MPHAALRAPLSVYMLADHLDAALAAGEDLVTRGQDWRALAEKPGPTQPFLVHQRRIAEDVRGLELILIARVLKARDHARALSTADTRFRLIADLFIAGTNILMDAVEECGDARGEDFDSGELLTAYVRSRGLIAPDAASITAPTDLVIDDNFLVAKRITLGPLLDMASSFLDALDAQFDLFVEEDVDGKRRMPRERDEATRLSLN